MRPLGVRPLDEVPVAVLDFETTGLSVARGDRVVEVAVLRVDPDGVRRTFASLVDPQRDMPDETIAIHGITPDMLVGAPFFEDVLPRFAPMLDGAVLVAHNAPFDIGFLRTECRRLGQQPPRLGPVVDTLVVAREFLHLPRCNLGTLARRVGWQHGQAHRALADVYATHALFQAIVTTLDPERTPTATLLHRRVQLNGKGSAARRRIGRVLRTAAAGHHDIVIDYTSSVSGPLVLRRRISVKALESPYLRGWCHLRQEDRRFKIDRIHRAVRVD